LPAHHCRKSFLLWLQSVGYKQKHGGFAYERSSRLRSNEVPGGDFKRRNGLASARWRDQVPTSSDLGEKQSDAGEAAAYSGIGINKLREMSDSKDCTFVLWNGTKRLLKRRRLDEHLDRLFSI
jgi:hypothetical protein